MVTAVIAQTCYILGKAASSAESQCPICKGKLRRVDLVVKLFVLFLPVEARAVMLACLGLR